MRKGGRKKGFVPTPETRAKQAASMRARWAQKDTPAVAFRDEIPKSTLHMRAVHQWEMLLLVAQHEKTRTQGNYVAHSLMKFAMNELDLSYEEARTLRERVQRQWDKDGGLERIELQFNAALEHARDRANRPLAA